MTNTTLELHTGYTPYFSFTTGFQPATSIASTTLTDTGPSGYLYTITYADGSRIEFGLNEGGTTNGQAATFDNLLYYSFATVAGGHRILDNLSVANPGQLASIQIFDPSNSSVALFSGYQDWTGSVLGSGFVTHWLDENNVIRPSDSVGNTVSDNQTIYGYTGNDNILGGIGNDVIFGGAGQNSLSGGDSGEGATGNDTFVFYAGEITTAVNSFTTIHGTDINFNGALQPGEINTIEARGNNDFSLAEIQRITRLLFNGATALEFGAASFAVSTGFSPDTTIVGDGGSNAISVWMNPADISPGHSDIRGASTLDLSSLVFQSWTAGQDAFTIVADQTGLAGTPSIVAPNVATTMIGGQNGEDLSGGTANDTLIGGAGNDSLDGGGGTDTASYIGTAAVTVSLATTTQQNTVGAGLDTLTGIENLVGSSAGDRLTGNGGRNVISGANGNDTLTGGFGNDRLIGGTGNDSLVGGQGNDTLEGSTGNDTLAGWQGNDRLAGGAGLDSFLFNTALGATNIDTIVDYVVADDTILLENAVFTAFGAFTGTLWVQGFHTGTAAHDASDRIIYDSASGALYYDPDGTGAQAQVQFATLTTGLALTNADIRIV